MRIVSGMFLNTWSYTKTYLLRHWVEGHNTRLQKCASLFRIILCDYKAVNMSNMSVRMFCFNMTLCYACNIAMCFFSIRLWILEPIDRSLRNLLWSLSFEVDFCVNNFTALAVGDKKHKFMIYMYNLPCEIYGPEITYVSKCKEYTDFVKTFFL